MSTKSRAYEILRKNGTLERIWAQLQLAVFESMGLQKSTTSKTSRPSRREIGKLAKREFQSLLSLLFLRMPLVMKMYCADIAIHDFLYSKRRTKIQVERANDSNKYAVYRYDREYSEQI